MRKALVLFLSIILTIISIDYNKKSKPPAADKKGTKSLTGKNE
ncbi:MAG TPA: hypothetical protein VHO28_15390 [Ignavibacteriales bacterium]|nr:hypothetical protein [Ignavibacteriales bacterium]